MSCVWFIYSEMSFILGRILTSSSVFSFPSSLIHSLSAGVKSEVDSLQEQFHPRAHDWEFQISHLYESIQIEFIFFYVR
jgi:hypothetical protein